MPHHEDPLTVDIDTLVAIKCLYPRVLYGRYTL